MVQAIRRLVAIPIVVGLLLTGTAVQVVTAGTQGSCAGADTSKVLLWENAIGDTVDGNDNYWKCASDSSLNVGDDHTLPGDCKGFFLPSTSWQDCVSSYTVWVPAGNCLIFYRDTNYSADFAVFAGSRANQRFNVPSASNDTLSSFRWVSC